MWNLILLDEPGKQCWIFLDDSKSFPFISLLLEQQLNNQSRFIIIDTIVGERQRYDDAASETLIWMCE